MKPTIIPTKNQSQTLDNGSWLENISRKMVCSQLANLEFGEIVVREQGNDYYFGTVDDSFPLRVIIEVNRPDMWVDIAFGGSSGAGEAYMKESWNCDNLVDLVRIFLRNRHVLNQMDERLLRLKQPLHKIMHWMSRNTRNGSQRNISAHYDLGNEFFKLFLDPSMMYSSAYYASPSMSLNDAAILKLQRICEKLELKAKDHVLEIGTGWGGFAIYAAQNYGCQVTTTTISREQFDAATKRVKAAGLQERVTVLLQDYRDLEGQYDKLVSIEMIEAVGHQFMGTYFNRCSNLLKPEGVMLLQAITIADQLYKSALKDVDFIKKYIFPGGFLPSIEAMSKSLSRATDMKIFHLEDIGPHYARTLSDWRKRFFMRLESIKALNYSESFIRMWEFYLCYCEGGFRERDIGTVQMVLTKPRSRI